jgi:hypothetical protein
LSEIASQYATEPVDELHVEGIVEAHLFAHDLHLRLGRLRAEDDPRRVAWGQVDKRKNDDPDHQQNW